MCRTFQFQIFLTWECQLCIVCVATVRGFAFFAVLLSLTWLQVLWFVRTLYSGVFPLDKPAEFITVFSLRKVREEKHNSFMGNYFTNMRSDSNGEVVKRLFPYITENLLPTRKKKIRTASEIMWCFGRSRPVPRLVILDQFYFQFYILLNDLLQWLIACSHQFCTTTVIENFNPDKVCNPEIELHMW